MHPVYFLNVDPDKLIGSSGGGAGRVANHIPGVAGATPSHPGGHAPAPTAPPPPYDPEEFPHWDKEKRRWPVYYLARKKMNVDH